eukprot:11542542-Prorocentrum_lima.AAC.1
MAQEHAQYFHAVLRRNPFQMFREDWDLTYRNRIYAQHLGDDEVMRRSLKDERLSPGLRSPLVDWSAYGRGWRGDGSGEDLEAHFAANPPPTSQSDCTAFSR